MKLNKERKKEIAKTISGGYFLLFLFCYVITL